MPSHGAVQERYMIVPDDRRGVGICQEWDYAGSLFIVGDAAAGQQWTALEGVLAEIVERHGRGGVLGGVSQPAVPCIVVKLLARSAPMLTEVLMELWAAARHVLWRMPPANFRKY